MISLIAKGRNPGTLTEGQSDVTCELADTLEQPGRHILPAAIDILGEHFFDSLFHSGLNLFAFFAVLLRDRNSEECAERYRESETGISLSAFDTASHSPIILAAPSGVLTAHCV